MSQGPPNPDETISLDANQDLGDQHLQPCSPHASKVTEKPEEYPRRIGRYEVKGVLGRGGFGIVYLGYDAPLQRHVAIKVPHRQTLSKRGRTEAYLDEARLLARLDHPHIIPVLDFGTSDEIPCFFVSKHIDGRSLSERMRQSRFSYGEAAELTATVAEALHYAHKQGLVHRDIKPGNILIDFSGKTYVVDFGLAIKEEDLGKGPRHPGTPAYMSPEQARGEGHRVDGRSDIYSLGAVLYQMLTGRRTFTADNTEELLELIANQEPKPPRQIDDRIPKELERICLKALSRRASDRYTTGKDMAEDLRYFLSESEGKQATANVAPDTQDHPVADSSTARADSKTPASDSQPIRIVPKGLRSFDEHDADFFLELLPGPRDREGLPDSIRFWKARIEEADPNKTFTVGLIYGPSGCGKSSLVGAGLLPSLSADVIPVYVEATRHETESRLLNGLRRACPGVPQNLDLKQTLTVLRNGYGLPLGKKVLIILDQFEQWLHANRPEPQGELIPAMRQCDGGAVQCILMVRDDFWMASTRFMHELEVQLLEGHNSAAVDLFTVKHAERVLAALGRAFGALPNSPNEVTVDQKKFLTQAITSLSQDDKVICIRLSLFADMMKAKVWNSSLLKQVGGNARLGVMFLEDTFSASTSPPEHRYHEKAARAVLGVLLPESGTNIRGHMRSYDELLSVSGYTTRPNDFDELLAVLDRDLRLITPADTATEEPADSCSIQPASNRDRYQLTHDYLVPSLREWLTQKQKQTRRGRAELRLAECAAAWNAQPCNRNLPDCWQYASILAFTTKNSRTEAQQKMMRAAGRFYGIRWSLALLLFCAVGLAIAWPIHKYQLEVSRRKVQQEELYQQELQLQFQTDLSASNEYLSLVAEARSWLVQPHGRQKHEMLNKLLTAVDIPTSVKDPVDLRSLLAATLSQVALHPAQQIEEAGSHSFSCLSFSPNGQYLALGRHKGHPCFVKLLEFGSSRGQILPFLDIRRTRETGVGSLAFDSSGHKLYAGTRGGDIRIWNLSKLTDGFTENIAIESTAISNAPDLIQSSLGGLMSSILGTDSSAAIRKDDRGVHLMGLHQGNVRGLAVTADDKYLASVATDGKLKVLDASTYEKLVVHDVGHPLSAVCFTHDGRTLFAAGNSGIFLYTYPFAEAPVQLWSQPTSRLKLTPDNQELFVGGADGRLGVIHVGDTSNPSAVDFHPSTTHDEHIIGLDVDNTGTLVATTSDDNRVRLWLRDTGRLVDEIVLPGGDGKDAAFAPDGQTLVATGNGKTSTYRIDGIGESSTIAYDTGPIQGVEFCPHGRFLATVRLLPNAPQYGSVSVSVWDTATAVLLGKMEFAFTPAEGFCEGPILAFHDDGRHFAISHSGQVHLAAIDETSFSRIGSSDPFARSINGLGFSSDSGVLLVAHANKLSTVSVPHLEIVHTWTNVLRHVRGFVGFRGISVSDELAVLGDLDGTVRLFLPSSMESTFAGTRKGSDNVAVRHVALSPDSRLLAAGDDGGGVRVITIDEGKTIFSEQKAHRDQIQSLAMSNTVAGLMLATGSRDGKLNLWHFARGTFHKSLSLQTAGAVLSVRFSPDGRQLAQIVDGERAVRLWHLDRLDPHFQKLGLGWSTSE